MYMHLEFNRNDDGKDKKKKSKSKKVAKRKDTKSSKGSGRQSSAAAMEFSSEQEIDSESSSLHSKDSLVHSEFESSSDEDFVDSDDTDVFDFRAESGRLILTDDEKNNLKIKKKKKTKCFKMMESLEQTSMGKCCSRIKASFVNSCFI